MIKKTHLFLAITLILSTFLIGGTYAQSVNWGELNRANTKNYYPRIVGEDAKNIYTYYFLDGDLSLESYSKDQMKIRFSKKVEMGKVNGNKVQIKKVSFLVDKFLVFASYYDKAAKSSKIFAQTINTISRKTSKRVELFEIPVDNKKRSGEFYLFLSQDKTKILLNHYAYSKKYRQYKDWYKLIDSDLNILLDREDVFEKGEKDYRTSHYTVNNEGSLFFLKNVSSTENYIVSYDAKKNYEKWEESIDIAKVGLDMGSKITDITFNINSKSDLIISGYYTEGESNLDGCFFLKIDSRSKETEAIKLNKFDQEFIDQFIKKRWLFEGSPELLNEFKSIDIVNKTDGGIILIGEKYEKRVITSNQGSTTYETFGDLIILNLSSEGELLWANKIPKLQKYNDGYGSILKDARTSDYYSYLIGVNEQKAVILFNDHKANTLSTDNENKLKALKNIDNAYITLYNIDLKTGEKQKEMFSDAKSLEVLFKPSTSYQKDHNSDIIIFGRKNKKFKYGVLSL